jgi:hypothetical protein
MTSAQARYARVLCAARLAYPRMCDCPLGAVECPHDAACVELRVSLANLLATEGLEVVRDDIIFLDDVEEA